MSDVELDVSPEETAYQARELQHLLKHPLVLAAFAETEIAIVNQWKVAKDPLSREMCWHKLHGFRELLTKFRAFSERPSLTITE